MWCFHPVSPSTTAEKVRAYCLIVVWGERATDFCVVSQTKRNALFQYVTPPPPPAIVWVSKHWTVVIRSIASSQEFCLPLSTAGCFPLTCFPFLFISNRQCRFPPLPPQPSHTHSHSSSSRSWGEKLQESGTRDGGGGGGGGGGEAGGGEMFLN